MNTHEPRPKAATPSTGRVLLLLTAALSLALAASRTPGQAAPQRALQVPRYVFTDLGTLGGSSSQATALNEAGQVVGSAANAEMPTQVSHAFLWENGQMRDLGVLQPGHQSFAEDINEAGQVTGRSGPPRGLLYLHRAFLWQANVMQDVGVLPGDVGSAGWAINDSGQIAGTSYSDRPAPHAFLWQGGTMQDLPLIPNLQGAPDHFRRDSEAFGLNNQGQAVGYNERNDPSRLILEDVAVLWTGGQPAELPVGPTNLRSTAYDVNQTSRAVGTVVKRDETTGAATTLAFLWENGQGRSLGGLPGSSANIAWAVNDGGQVVGESQLSGVSHAWLWESGALTDLNSFLPPNSGWVLLNARDINNRGQIVGTGSRRGPARAYLASPAALARSDLSVTKTGSPDTLKTGETLTYSFTVRNNGGETAAGVTLTDTLPANVALVSVTPAVIRSGNTLSFDFGVMEPGTSATATVVVRPTRGGTLTNTATVTGAGVDPAGGNNTAVVNTTVLPVTDLSLAKSVTPTAVKVGQNLTYTLTVRNAGPDPATGVTLTDALPAGFTLQSATATQGSFAQAGADLTFSLGDLAAEGIATATLVVTPTQASQAPVRNTARVTAPEFDSDPANNSASAEVTVQELNADLIVTLADAPDPVEVGKNLTYTITLANVGPDPAANVVLTHTLPAGATSVSATPSRGSCTLDAGRVFCTLDSLAAGETVTATVVVTVPSAGTATSTVQVSSGTVDPNGANNTRTTTTEVQAGGFPDLAGRWEGRPRFRSSGRGRNRTYTLQWSFTIGNSGQAPASPSRVRFDISGIRGVRVEQSVGVLEPGQTRRLQYGVRLPRGVTPARLRRREAVATLDAGQAVAEANERNNAVSARFP